LSSSKIIMMAGCILKSGVNKLSAQYKDVSLFFVTQDGHEKNYFVSDLDRVFHRFVDHLRSVSVALSGVFGAGPWRIPAILSQFSQPGTTGFPDQIAADNHTGFFTEND